ncbi:hypothetical protein GCM10009737_28190 [Nocardioides lentus]|uniref:Uncharacterized protein n=1 Tax=Nocardioides lentus TaxID=338077 RepID=A0ABP5B0H3_9ACTN
MSETGFIALTETGFIAVRRAYVVSTRPTPSDVSETGFIALTETGFIAVRRATVAADPEAPSTSVVRSLVVARRANVAPRSLSADTVADVIAELSA